MKHTHPDRRARVDTAAQTVESARRAVSLIEPLTSSWPDLDSATAYAIADRAAQLRRDLTGARPVGRKIGFTNRTIWDLYGVHDPMWGWMYDDTVSLVSGDRAEVDTATLAQPRVEPEIVVRLARPLLPGCTVGEAAAALEWVAFGFEIVQCHYPGWRFRAPDTVADGGLHGASRIGRQVAPWAGLADDLAACSLTLLRDGVVVGVGRGHDVLDSPLHALVHLAALVGGDGLAAGEIVTTGTLTDAAPATPGAQYTVRIDGLPLSPLVLTCG